MSTEVELTVTDNAHFYKGREYDAQGKIVSLSWLRTVEPPYLVGRALRVRIKDNAWHFGVCKSTTVFARPVELTPEEIGSWHFESDSSETSESVSP